MTVATKCHPHQIVRHPLLITVVLPTSLLFLLAAWSPPLVYHNLSDWYGSWQQSMFAFVCHQQLDRTFFIHGIPLAVCSRCTGIYTGLFFGLLFFSFFTDFVKKTEHYINRVFFTLSFVVLLDGCANLLQFWQTTPELRLLTGGVWAVSTGAVLVRALNIPRK